MTDTQRILLTVAVYLLGMLGYKQRSNSIAMLAWPLVPAITVGCLAFGVLWTIWNACVKDAMRIITYLEDRT